MARLGEYLISAGLVAADKVDQALRAQVVYGGRLGTNLIEVAGLDLDELSRALGQQHGVPAALARHFEKADPVLQAQLPHDIARQFCVVPLVRLSPDRIAVVGLDPLTPAALDALASAYDVDPREGIICSVAAEMRVLYHLERVYQIARTSRYLRTRGPAPASEFEIPIDIDDSDGVSITDETRPTGRVELADLAEPTANADDIAAMIDLAIENVTASPSADDEPTGRERRTYLRTLGEESAPPVETASGTLGRMAIKKVAVTPSGGVLSVVAVQEARVGGPATFAEALKAIRRGPQRDRVAELVVETLDRFVPACTAALLLVIRGNVAIGWKHFARGSEAAPEVAVPLDQPGIVPAVIDRQQMGRCAAPELGPIDRLLFREIGGTHGDLVVAPVMIGSRVMCLLAAATERQTDVTPLDAVVTAAGAAFVRLIRDASR